MSGGKACAYERTSTAEVQEFACQGPHRRAECVDRAAWLRLVVLWDHSAAAPGFQREGGRIGETRGRSGEGWMPPVYRGSEDTTVRSSFVCSAAPNSLERQVGTATYLIDFLALRVGGEKDTGQLTPTVGALSTRARRFCARVQAAATVRQVRVFLPVHGWVSRSARLQERVLRTGHAGVCLSLCMS